MSDDFDPTLAQRMPTFKSKLAAERAQEVRDGIFGRDPDQKSIGWTLLAKMLGETGTAKQFAVEIAMEPRTRPYLERAQESRHSKVRTSASTARNAIRMHIGDAVFFAPRLKGSVLSG